MLKDHITLGQNIRALRVMLGLLGPFAFQYPTIIATLLYGCESWITYRRHVRSLDQFHMRCLRRIARIKWQDKITNTEVLQLSLIHI